VVTDYQDSPSQGGTSPPFGADCFERLFFVWKKYHKPTRARSIMAAKRTSTFFLRFNQNLQDDNTFYQGENDIGAYVNVLDKAVLSIKSIQVSVSDSTGRMPNITSGEGAAFSWQLTTQSQTDVVLLSDNSVVASGGGSAEEKGTGQIAVNWSDWDIGPSHFTTDLGYMVATESLYLGGSASTGFAEDVYVSLLLECQVVTMDVQDGVALALSQQ